MPENKTCTASFSPRKMTPTQRSFPRKEVLREDVRDASRCRRAKHSRRNPPPRTKSGVGSNLPSFSRSNTVPNEPGHQSLESRSHWRRHVQGRRIKRNSWSHSHFRSPRASCAAARSSTARRAASSSDGPRIATPDRARAGSPRAIDSSGSGRTRLDDIGRQSAPTRRDTSNRVCRLGGGTARAG